MRTFLSQDATARCSLAGEKRRSEILSSGGIVRATSFEISPEVLFWAVVAGVVPTEPKSDISRCDDSALFSVLLFSLGAGAERGRRKGKRGVSETQAMKKRNKRRKRRKCLPSERSSLSGSVQRGGGSNEAKRALISQKGKIVA